MRNPAAAAFAGSDAPHPMSPAPAWASGVHAGRFSQFMGGPPTSWPQGGDGAASFGAATSAGISGGGMGYPSSWPAGPAYGASYGGQGEGTPPPNYDDAWLAHAKIGRASCRERVCQYV